MGYQVKVPVLRNYARVTEILDEPKSVRRPLIEAIEQVKKSGSQSVYGGVHFFPVCDSREVKPGSVQIIGTEESGILKPQSAWEISYVEDGVKKGLRFYFCVSFSAKQSPPRFGMAQTADGAMMSTIVTTTPRLLYIASVPLNGRYQRTGFNMDDMHRAAALFSKPRFVALQREGGFEIVADVISKELIMSMGSGLISLQGELFEV